MHNILILILACLSDFHFCFTFVKLPVMSEFSRVNEFCESTVSSWVMTPL
jgi:hypothetical protein